MTTICCNRCAREHQRDYTIRLALGEPTRPCLCACHVLRRVEDPPEEPTRGVVIGVLMVVVPWVFLASLFYWVIS